MQAFLKVCCACLEPSNFPLVDVCALDKDKISFLDKIKACVSGSLERDCLKQLCLQCIGKLQEAYCFQQMVLLSQDVLNKSKFDQTLPVNQHEINIKEELHDAHNFTKEEAKDLEQGSAEYDTYLSDDPQEYTCYNCNLGFDKRWKLQKHIGTIHLQYRRFLCTYCKKTFKQLYHLKEHLTSHTGERNFTCSLCCKSFQRLSSLRRHSQSHQRAPGQKTNKTPFLCTICGKNFPFSNGVQRHMRVHTGVRNHECNVCRRRFSQSTHLQVHMRTHTGEKPYICETCGAAFSLNASLIKHMKIH